MYMNMHVFPAWQEVVMCASLCCLHVQERGEGALKAAKSESAAAATQRAEMSALAEGLAQERGQLLALAAQLTVGHACMQTPWCPDLA